MAIAGFDEVEIREGEQYQVYNGSFAHNGQVRYSQPAPWAIYRLYINRPISITQAAGVRTMLEQTAPARSHLVEVNFERAAMRYDGSMTYNHEYTHGAVKWQ